MRIGSNGPNGRLIVSLNAGTVKESKANSRKKPEVAPVLMVSLKQNPRNVTGNFAIRVWNTLKIVLHIDNTFD